jgi:hypothetical protein
MTEDPRPEPRIVDPTASKRKLLLDRWCRACGALACNCHHLLGKGGRRGDDVLDNLVQLCGSGSHGCHGALHGNPYIDRFGQRWDARKVRTNIGLRLTTPELGYLVATLTPDPAAEYLRTAYYVKIVSTNPPLLEEAA